MFNHQKLECYRKALELLKKSPRLMATWSKGTGYLQDQFRRALSSVVLNIAEGNGRTSPKERKRFFVIARASATEVAAIVDVAYALQLLDATEQSLFQDHLLQIVKMLYKLR